ncbi:MAG: DUF3566 domain-containing protein, partial [Trebonia sp.]
MSQPSRPQTAEGGAHSPQSEFGPTTWSNAGRTDGHGGHAGKNTDTLAAPMASSPDDGPPHAAGSRGPRRARLQLRHVNPWTVLRFSCVLAVALFFVWLIVIGILYGVLDAAGVIGKVNHTVVTINGPG